MDKKYSVDDILDDIKRKKQNRSEGFSAYTVSEPETKAVSPIPVITRLERPSIVMENPKEQYIPIPQRKPTPVRTSSTVERDRVETLSREEIEQRNKELYAKLATLDQPNKKAPPKVNSTEVKSETKNSKFSNSVAHAFGDNAYKPYEDTTKKEKGFSKSFPPTPPSKAPRPTTTSLSKSIYTTFTTANIPTNKVNTSLEQSNIVEDVVEYTQSKSISESIRETVREIIPDTNYDHDNIAPKSISEAFKLNIVNSFFEEDVKEDTKMNIPVTHVENPNAAMGFTRSIPAQSPPKARTKLKTKEQEEEELFLSDDYENPSEAGEISRDLSKAVSGTTIRLILMGIIFGLLLYATYSLHNPLPLPSFMFPEKDPFNFVAINLGITVLGALICSNAVGTGLIALFTLKPDSDTPIAMALLASIAQGVALLVSPDMIYADGVNMYFVVIGFGLFINTFGKLLMAKRIRNNFKVIASKEEKYAVGLFTDKSIIKELTRGQHTQNPSVAYSCKANFLTGYLYYSYSEDYSENLNRVASPLFLAFNTIIAVVSYVLFKDLYVTLTVFTALMCICSPITATIVGNLPLMRISKKLNKQKAAIAGYKSLEDFDDVTTVAVDANEFFVGGSVILHGIKPFAEDRIDEAIIDAASAIMQANGLLTDIFLEMIGRKENLLKEVDSLVYEDCMGLSAWVDSKRVLIGNRQLMENHGIDIPPYEYEKKFVNNGREVLYIANSGELTTMFVLSYHGTEEMSKNLDKLAAKGIGLSVYTTDPNITANKLEEIFGFPAELITIMSSKIHAAFNQTACDREKAPAKVALPSDFISNISVICSILSGKTAIVFGTVLQLLGLIFGYAFIVFYTFTGEISTVTYSYLLLFQIVWGILTIIIANLRKL